MNIRKGKTRIVSDERLVRSFEHQEGEKWGFKGCNLGTRRGKIGFMNDGGLNGLSKN
jgi:hypothetical protein